MVSEQTTILNFKETEVGLIPEDWKVVNLGELGNIQRGASPRPIDSPVWFDENSQIGWLRISDVSKSKKFLFNTTQNLSPQGIANSRFVSTGNLVMSICATVGRPIIVKKDVCIHDGFVVFNNLTVDKEYLYYILQDIEKEWSKSGQTGSQMNLNTTLINSTKIPLPPTIEEQTAIATALSDMDTLIESLEKLLIKKQNIKKGAMQELLKPKEGWQEKTLGDCANVIGGGTPSSFNPSYWNGNINWFTPTEVGDEKYIFESRRKITNEGYANSSAKMLPIGTILLTSRAGIGDLGILMEEGCTNQGFQSLIAKNNVDFQFLYYLMGTLKNQLHQNSSGSTFLEISPAKIKSIEVKIPHIKEQKKIATTLSDMDSEINSLRKQLIKFKQIKTGMMQELLTGKKRLI